MYPPSRHYAQPMTETRLNWLWSMTTSLRSVAALCGYFLLPLFMDRLGRRVTGMLTANLLCIAAILFQVGAYLSDRYELYMVGGRSGK
jgi:hypothetical protein